MADPRTFTLIGEFKDGITPELEKINNTLNTLQRNISMMSSRRGGFKDLTEAMGKVVSAHKTLANSVKELREEMKDSISTLREYRSELGKAARANYAISRAGSKAAQSEARNWKEARKDLDSYTNGLKTLNRTGRTIRVAGGGGGGNRPPGGRGGGSRVRPPSGGGRSGYGSGGMGAHMGEFGFSYTLGNAISQPIQGAIVAGFQAGTQLMMGPFKYFAQNLQERMQDEMSDLKAAGGFFSLSREQKVGERLVNSFDEAVDYTQANNKLLDKIAASLPGSTQDYIEVSKRISDSIARTVIRDKAGSIRLAEQIRKADQSTYGYEEIKGSGPAAMKKATSIILGDLTTKTVLAGMGGRAGAGGSMGAYGLPQLTERMIGQDEVSLAQFQRYSAIFSDPMVMDALEKEIPKINATAKNSADRIIALRKMYERVLPPELIARYRRTLSGLTETFNTAIFGKESGIFGLGRKMKGLGKKMNEFGQYIDWYGKVTNDVNQAMNADLSLYDLFRDIVVNVGQIIAPIVENFTLLYDPLKQLGKVLGKAREVTAEVLRTFNIYLGGFEDLSKNLKGADAKKWGETGGNALRATLLTIGNLFRALEIISASDFSKLTDTLKKPDANTGAILKGMVDTFMNSEIAEGIGSFIGQIIGTVLVEISKVTGFLSKRIESSNKLIDGLKKGFKDAGGEKAFGLIVGDILKMMIDGIKLIWNVLPLEAKLLAAGMLIIPAAIQGIAMFIAEKLMAGITSLGRKCGNMMQTALGGACPMPGRRGGGRAPSIIPSATSPNRRNVGISTPSFRSIPSRAPDFGYIALPGKNSGVGGVTSPGRAPSIPKPPKRLVRPKFGPFQGIRAKGAGGIAAAMLTLSTKAPALGKAAKSATSLAKSLPGIGLGFTALDFAIRKAQGEKTSTAASGAIGAGVGGVVGGTLATAIPVPGATVVGATLGAMIGDWIGTNLAPALENLPAKLDNAFLTVKNWFLTLPETVGGWLGSIYAKLEKWALEIPILQEKIKKAWDDLRKKLADGATSFIAKAGETLSNPSTWGDLALKFAEGIRNALLATPIGMIFAGGAALPDILKRGADAFNTGRTVEKTVNPSPREGDRKFVEGIGSFTFRNGKWVKNAYRGSLGDAISSEMRNKPPGSNLVIANSSETVIPAAGGTGGMLELINTFRNGFVAMISTYRETQAKQETTLKGIQNTLRSNQDQTNMRLQKLETKMASPGLGGGLGGAPIGGGVDSFTGVASRFGLQMTSGYRPGDKGWHGVNRARDYSNGTGPTPQMMQFAQYMANNYGRNLKELIYTPLGFSIKNGQRVAPYAQAAHYNHVHVAAAMGVNNAVAFGRLTDARRFESAMKPAGARVASVTANSSEFGGSPTLNNNITIVQQPGQNSEELAAVVLQYLGDWVADARSSSIFV
jgi:hypothetical protein